MKDEHLLLLLFTILFIGLIFFCEYLNEKFGLKTEITRKFAHVISTLSCLSFLYFFESIWYVISLGTIFFLVLFLGKRYGAFKSINDVPRKTCGSPILPLSIACLFVVCKIANKELYFILPLLILSISDPLAGLIGVFYKGKMTKVTFFSKTYEKTYLGSFSFFASSFFLSLFTLHFYFDSHLLLIYLSLSVAFFSTFVEFISSNGWDNLTVPHSIVAVLYFASYLECI